MPMMMIIFRSVALVGGSVARAGFVVGRLWQRDYGQCCCDPIPSVYIGGAAVVVGVGGIGVHWSAGRRGRMKCEFSIRRRPPPIGTGGAPARSLRVATALASAPVPRSRIEITWPARFRQTDDDGRRLCAHIRHWKLADHGGGDGGYGGAQEARV